MPLLVLGALIALLARLAGGLGTPPLYDTFTLPDPYRYLHPTGGAHGSPLSATSTVAYTGQDVGALVVATRENPPQAQLIVAPNSLAVPSGARTVVASITPVDTPSGAPPNGVVVGNTYRFRVVTDSGAAVTLLPGKQATLVMRGPTGTASATIDVRSGSAWTPLSTSPIAGPDIWAASTSAFGDAALVGPEAHVSSGGFPWLPWAAGGAAVLIVGGEAAFLLLARRRRRARGRLSR